MKCKNCGRRIGPFPIDYCMRCVHKWLEAQRRFDIITAMASDPKTPFNEVIIRTFCDHCKKEIHISQVYELTHQPTSTKPFHLHWKCVPIFNRNIITYLADMKREGMA